MHAEFFLATQALILGTFIIPIEHTKTNIQVPYDALSGLYKNRKLFGAHVLNYIPDI